MTEQLYSTFRPTNSYANVYFKYILSGHKILVVIPTDNMIYLGKIVKEFENNQIFSDSIDYNNHTYFKIASDYQIVKCVEFGNPQDVEGEVLWADYLCEEVPETYISCAYVPKTNSRADIVGEIITTDGISI